MQAAIIVTVEVEEPSQIEVESQFIFDVLEQNGVAVVSVVPWARTGIMPDQTNLSALGQTQVAAPPI